MVHIWIYCEQKRHISTMKSKQGTGEIARWLKHMPCKYEDLNSDLHTHINDGQGW